MFNTRTIATLENLLGAKSFGGSIDHLTHCQVILHVFSSRFSLPFVIRTIALAFLGCWALITLTLVTCFQQDDHYILLDIIEHVEIGTSLFQMAI